MKRDHINILSFLLLAFLAFVSCGENEGNIPLENNSTPPGQVRNASVENLPGKAIISYTLPVDKDLLYIKAVYTLPATGKVSEVKSSYYNNSLTVEGFASTDPQEIKLYSVNRSEVASEPVTITINPLESPIWDVYRSIEVDNSFGGFNVKAQNEVKEDVVIEILAKNDFDEWEVTDFSIYSSITNISAQIRDLDTITYDFAFTVRDRWMNYSDTAFVPVNPFYEKLIPKTGYVGLHLPGDAEFNEKTKMSNMWDGEIINWPGIYQTEAAFTPTEPHILTIDIGQSVLVSRIKIWDYPEYFNGRTYYYLGNLKQFEIWGSAGYNPDGSLDDTWVLLGSFKETKPSGLPFGEQDDEDYNTAYAGFDWNVETVDMPKVRYIRIKSIKNWGGSTNMAIAELQIYGGDPDL